MLEDSATAVLGKRDNGSTWSPQRAAWLAKQTMALLEQVLLLEITSRYEVWGLYSQRWSHAFASNIIRKVSYGPGAQDKICGQKWEREERMWCSGQGGRQKRR